jgi:hypothetical protein
MNVNLPKGQRPFEEVGQQLRIPLDGLLDAAEFVVPQNTLCYGFYVNSLPAAVTLRFFIGNQGRPPFVLEAGNGWFLPCTPITTGIRLETNVAAAGSFLELLIFGAPPSLTLAS